MSYNRVKAGDEFIPSAKLNNDTIDLLNQVNLRGVSTIGAKTNSRIKGYANCDIEAKSFVFIEDFEKDEDGEIIAVFSNKFSEKTNLYFTHSEHEDGEMFSVESKGVATCDIDVFNKAITYANNVVSLKETEDFVLFEVGQTVNTHSFYLVTKVEDGDGFKLNITSGFYNINGVKFGTMTEGQIAFAKGFVCLHAEIEKIDSPIFMVVSSPSLNDYPLAYINENEEIVQYCTTVANFMISKPCPLAVAETQDESEGSDEV